jgi:hypothetical protein
MTMITSIGAPPERHADRVTALMLRDLAAKRARIRMAVVDAIHNSKDGNPRAQAKMAERMRKAGADCVMLKPGKRGKYTIQIYQWIGWDPIHDRVIDVDDPIPEKPWLAYLIFHIEYGGRGRGAVESKVVPVLLVTHHCLSRAAQRRDPHRRSHVQRRPSHQGCGAQDAPRELRERASLDAAAAARAASAARCR